MQHNQTLRVPPHSLEAEQSVIGSILIADKNQAIREACDLLTPEMFYNQSHRSIFRVVLEMMPTQHEIDLVTLTDKLEDKQILDEIGGFAYIGELSKNTPSASNILAYADQVRTLSQKRELIALGNKIIEMGFGTESIDDVIDTTKAALANIDTGSSYEPKELGQLMAPLINQLDRRCQNDETALPIKTGLTELDNSAGGFDWEQLIVLGGRPSHGKTLVSQYITLTVSRKLPVKFFSMEMGELKIAERFVSLLSGIDPEKFKLGELEDEDWAKASDAMQQINSKQVDILIDETPRLSVNQIRARTKSTIKKRGKLGMIVIDYLGLMQLPKADRHDLALAEVTRSLKELSKEIKTPILLLAQANRELDKADRPTMSHIKDSSSIEADADMIFFAHMPGKDDPNSPWGDAITVYNAKDRDTHAKDSYLRRGQFGLMGNLTPKELGEIHQKQETANQPPIKQMRAARYTG